MEKWICILLSLLFGGFPVGKSNADKPASRQTLSYVQITQDTPPDEQKPYLRAVWLSQFDMQPIYRDGNRQRDESDFRALCVQLCEVLCADGFNTVFLQLRPNGDSMYESELFPLSKYVAGEYGGQIDYDVVSVFLSAARDAGLSVHGWINPLRLVTENEMTLIPNGYAVRDWYDAKSGQVKECNGRLYLDPSYAEVRQLIADGAHEILERYALDGIHMDDYFYPTTDPVFDEWEFQTDGCDSLTQFRQNNINCLVKQLYTTVHETGADKQFGISPAGNLDSLAEGYYADAKLWCSESGYIDYILPQLYFGFENAYCPFDVMVKRWSETVTAETVALYIGLDAAKAVQGMQGQADEFAGTVEGKTEWIRRRDVLSRSMTVLYDSPRVSGYCFFSYSYLYDRFDGQVVEAFLPSYELLRPYLIS